MKHIVYITVNKINNKVYIGVHQTENPDIFDNYLGCGVYANSPKTYRKCNTPFAAAVHKYGPKNFRRYTLKIFDTRKEALQLEGILVDEKFIKKTSNYNCIVGGGAPPILAKKIYQYDLSGKLIKEWPSLKSAADFYNLTHTDGFRYAEQSKKSYKNSYWCNDKLDVLDISNYTTVKYRTEICVYNENLEMINTFESVSEAEKAYELNKGTVANALYDKYKINGLIFLRADEDIDEFFKVKESKVLVASTKIYLYDALTGNFIKTFETMRECIKSFKMSNRTLVNLLENNLERDGYKFSYYKVNNILNEIISNKPDKPSKINQYNLETNELIKTWDITECKKLYPNCIKVCRGTRKSAYGYKWEYVK